MKLDPLYVIFEKHLKDVDNVHDPLSPAQRESAEFVDTIIEEYLKSLTKNKVAVPQRWRAQIIEELRDQVRQMLLKKTYGCLSIEDYQRQKTPKRKKSTRKKRFNKFF